VIGQSELDNPVYAVDVANSVDFQDTEQLDDLPTMYVAGRHHGNEPLSVEAAYHFLRDVLETAAENPAYLEGRRLIVTPVVNPDGYVRDRRTNAGQVDLDRNCPFHWARYGSSEVPGHPNHHGSAPASAPETEADIELMRNANLYAYVGTHVGERGLVRPWNPTEDGTPPDAALYEATFAKLEAATGLGPRDLAGAGTVPAYAHGNRTATSLALHVDDERYAPASIPSVEQRLEPELGVYHTLWENLTHVGGELHAERVNESAVRVTNDGWGAAH
jgi:hypothetical protein